jgi:hypothetical protein
MSEEPDRFGASVIDIWAVVAIEDATTEGPLYARPASPRQSLYLVFFDSYWRIIGCLSLSEDRSLER